MTREEFYGRLIELPEMVSRIRSRSYVPGYHRAMIKTGGSEFERSAPFNFGEHDAKKYAFRLSAKVGKPMRVIKSEKKENLFCCMVAMNPSLSFGAVRTVREFAIELAGVLGFTAFATDDRAQVAAIGIGRNALPGRSGRNRNIFLAQLMELYDLPHAMDEGDIVGDIEIAANIIPKGASAFIISDWIFPPDPSCPGAPLSAQEPYKRLAGCFERLSVRCEIGLIVVDDVRARELPKTAFRVRSGPRTPMLTIGGKGRARAELKKLYEERQEWLEGLQEQYSNIDSCTLSTTDDGFEYLPDVMAYLAQRRAR